MSPSAPSASPRGRYAKGERARTEIIAVATDLFARQGYNGTSMREIALAAGLTHPGLTHHFPSKPELLAAVLQHQDEVSVGRWSGSQRAPKDALRNRVKENLDNGGLVQFMLNLATEAAAADHPAREYFQRHYQAEQQLLISVVERGQELGEFRTDMTAGEIALVLGSFWNGLELRWLVVPKVEMLAVFDSMLQALSPPMA